MALCRSLDLPLREIGDLLGCVDDGCCASAQPRLRRLLGEKQQEVDRRITLLQDLRRQLESVQRLPERAEGREPASCTPTTNLTECAFGDVPS